MLQPFFTPTDIVLLKCCVASALIGGFCDWTLVRDDFRKLPVEDPKPLPWKRWAPLGLGRMLLSVAGGAVVWLMLVDTVQPGKGPAARVMLIAFLAGFLATELGPHLKRRFPF